MRGRLRRERAFRQLGFRALPGRPELWPRCIDDAAFSPALEPLRVARFEGLGGAPRGDGACDPAVGEVYLRGGEGWGASNGEVARPPRRAGPRRRAAQDRGVAPRRSAACDRGVAA